MPLSPDHGVAVDARVLRERYRDLLNQFAGLAQAERVRVVPYRQDELAFDALPLEQRRVIVHWFDVYLNACLDVRAAAGSLREDKTLLWRMLKRLGFRQPAELFDRIRSDDLVEIYLLPEQIQVYRNMLYYEVNSYSLDEVLARPWFDLYSRNKAIDDLITVDIGRLLALKTPTILSASAPRHYCEETSSALKLRSDTEHRLVAPLFDANGRMAGAVSLFQMFGVDRPDGAGWVPFWRPQAPGA